MRKMPWILIGYSTFLRDRLLKKYTLSELMLDDTWYAEVIEAPEKDFLSVHTNDIKSIYEYYSPSVVELNEIKEKYGNSKPFTVVIEKLMELYDMAYQKAMRKLDTC